MTSLSASPVGMLMAHHKHRAITTRHSMGNRGSPGQPDKCEERAEAPTSRVHLTIASRAERVFRCPVTCDMLMEPENGN